MKTLLAAFLLLSPSLVLAADDVAPGGVVVQPAVAQPSLSPPAPPENPAPPPSRPRPPMKPQRPGSGFTPDSTAGCGCPTGTRTPTSPPMVVRRTCTCITRRSDGLGWWRLGFTAGDRSRSSASMGRRVSVGSGPASAAGPAFEVPSRTSTAAAFGPEAVGRVVSGAGHPFHSILQARGVASQRPARVS